MDVVAGEALSAIERLELDEACDPYVVAAGYEELEQTGLLKTIQIDKDMSGHDRVVMARRMPA